MENFPGDELKEVQTPISMMQLVFTFALGLGFGLLIAAVLYGLGFFHDYAVCY